MSASILARSLVAALALLAGCQEAPAPLASAPARPRVVATIYPVQEFSRQIAGEHAEIVSLIPPGVEPHHWEPTPADINRVRGARMLVYNGAGLEGWIDRFLATLSGTDTVVVNASEGLALVHADMPGHAHRHPHADARADATPAADRAGGPDPHVWLDPVLAQAQVEAIRAGLARVASARAAVFEENARRFTATLAVLHQQYEEGLARCHRRDIVVSHAAFTYLARRYKLLQVPIGLNPDAEPTPADLASVVRFARRHKVQYIFFETLTSPKVAETLAREVGARTLVLNPLEGLRDEDVAAGRHYVSVMQANLEQLRTALGCR